MLATMRLSLFLVALFRSPIFEGYSGCAPIGLSPTTIERKVIFIAFIVAEHLQAPLW